MPSVLWGDSGWIETIFDCVVYTVKRTHVDALFLSLCALQVLNIEEVLNKVRWNIA